MGWIVFFACLLAAFGFFYYQTTAVRVTEFDYQNPNAPEEPVRAAVLADLHDMGLENQVMRRLEEINPDVVLIPGDMVVKITANCKHAQRLLLALAKKYPVFYSPGNHEKREEQNPKFLSYLQKVEGAGVCYLKNQTAFFGGMAICGFDYADYEAKRLPDDALRAAFGKKPPFCVLLAHNPFWLSAYGDWGADLVLSGHVHGGQIYLPFIGPVLAPGFHFFPKIFAGRYTAKNTTMLVSRGLGVHTVRLRLFCRPEIVVVNIHR